MDKIKTKPQSLLDGLDAEARHDVLPVVFVCMSLQLTAEQEQDLHQSFGVLTGWAKSGEPDMEVPIKQVRIVTVSAELKKLTSQLPADYTLAEVQEVAKQVVAEAVAYDATYFVCMGDPTLAMWANLHASNMLGDNSYGQMTCLASTDNHIEGHKVQDDGSVATVNASKHVQWRPMF